ARRPAETVVLPWYVLALVRASVPAVALLSPPTPETTPLSVETLPPVSILAVELSTTLRATSMPAVVTSVVPAPLKVSAPDTSPRLALLAIDTVPALIVVPPLYVFVLVRASVPEPALLKPAVPETTPLRVLVLPCVSSVPPVEVSDTLRATVTLARVWSVPPPRVSAPLVLPRFASAEIATVPALTTVPPE